MHLNHKWACLLFFWKIMYAPWSKLSGKLKSCINPKRAGGGICPPLDIFCYISAGCYFFALKLHDFFPSSLALDLKPFLKKSDRGLWRGVNIALGPTKNWPKTDFQWKLHTNRVFFCIFCFSIHFHCVLSYLFGLLGVRTCVSILWHTSLPKNATFAWKNSENHDFGDFWWFSCFWHDVTYDVTVASYKVCLYFFGTNGLGRVIAIH